MDDVQSWPEVPSIAHFCSLFRAAFNLLDFDIEELEEALLTDGAEDAGSSLLQELIVRLLCGCIRNHEISTFNYQMFLRRLFRQKCQEYGRDNPFNTDIDFQFLPLRVKVEILHALCDFRLDAEDVPDLLKNLESDSLRVEPLGHDENRSAYWYFYGTRLYREDFPRLKKIVKERKKRRKEDKRKRRHSTESSELDEEPGEGVWQVVCYTEADWEALALKLKGSSCRDERELFRTLSEDFLPEIPRLFAEKERLQKKRLMDYQPRRQSSRLEKLKQKEFEENVLAREEEEKLRLERSERQRRERAMARAARLGSRHSSESPSEGSAGSELEDFEDYHPVVGRQTNNSLSSATGQIFIQPPKRKKLRSKQVFKTTTEDLRTGMYKILDYVKNHEDAWPFVTPVDEDYAPRYYSVIRRPMDLKRMEEKLDIGEYLDLNHFRDDFQLIVDNCRQYNGSENEYTEMVRNLQEAFDEAVDRYLESDPSSDEEVAVEFSSRGERHREGDRERDRDRERHADREKERHGDRERDREREKERDRPREKEKEARHKEVAPKRSKQKRKRRDKNKEIQSTSDSDSDLPPPLKPQRDRSPASEKSGSVPGSDFDDEEPDFLRERSPPRLQKADRVSESESSDDVPIRASRRPKHRKAVDMENLDAVTEETLKDINRWLEDTPLVAGFSSGSNSPSNNFLTEDFVVEPIRPVFKPERPFRGQRDPVRRRKPIDLLRPIKRKEIRTIERLQPGKSKGNLITTIPKPKEEESGVNIGLGLGRMLKESRNALLVKTDDAAPKLSLGTVLTSDIIDFGKSKHNFDNKTEQEIPEMKEDPVGVKEDSDSEMALPVTASQSFPVVETAPENKEEELSINKENDPLVEKPKEVTLVTQEKKRDGVKEITNKATPNASAWFKAFGAPKAPTNVKKKPELTEPPPPAEEKESKESPPPWGAASGAVGAGGIRRQRKASSSSSVSEPSSISQDSPLHPVSPGLISPRGEPPPPPINGTLRVGFYQDMSSLHKSSPEKQSPQSNSPREISNASPFQGFHVYPPSSPGTYGGYVTPSATPTHAPSTSLYESLPQYPTYSDQYRQPGRTVETFAYKPPEPVAKPNPSIFPVKKRLYANVDTARPLDASKESQTLQCEPSACNRQLYSEGTERYMMDPASYQHRFVPSEDKVSDVSRLRQAEVEGMKDSRLSTPHADLARLGMNAEIVRSKEPEPPRYHQDVLPMTDSNPKYPGPSMMEGLSRGFPSPLDRLMQQQPVNSIQEDSDGVFRKFPSESAYPASRHQPPVSAPSYPTSNLSHMVERFQDDRLLSNPYYDKNLYLKNVSSPSPLPMYQQDTSSQPQGSFELNIPKPRDPKIPKKKKTGKGTEQCGSTGFQQYVGLKPTEPSVPPISLKSTSAVPGSAFNFGPGLSNPLYTEGYLDELRQPAAYYGMPRGSSYPLPQFMSHQPGLVDGYQQYIQRMQEEQLRHSLAYQPGYHPALGMRPAFDRPSWL